MEKKTLNYAKTLQDAFVIGPKNAPSILAALILWLITIWIPYINIGTTIAITMLPIELSKGGIINPLGIFASKYRRYMGEFFITMGLMLLPLLFGLLLGIIPAIVMSLSWSLTYYYLLDRHKSPVAAIMASNDATYGSKWTMFFVSVTIGILFYIVTVLISRILLFDGDSTSLLIFIVLQLIVLALYVSIVMAVNASFWRQLKDNVE